ncbi:MAG: tRNA pseudouridine(55) synthase TruB [Bacteroidetes bacterium RIFCSPLOWO2_02_FULL_36_8]|nr:MAG: tRNA pseudouridine(55) synthase TruB [Bacteroidetes bacterium RIFCSPLOWO2_02_FULL_36_8]OFY69591.1 MAG: tRNA pseudouridine(55) synthase TruB [Bacteroidetes bacterium RIFCSPLOWO2_12_FULL_37_12]
MTLPLYNPALPDSGTMLLVDKPIGWTSFDVVNKIRYATGFPKVGHAGTLDPLATGLLIVCCGKMTKKINDFMGLEKEYTGSFVLGKTTPSLDRETAFSENFPIAHISNDMISDTVKKFTGEIEQIPPDYSAIKTGGAPAYKKARKGIALNLAPRKVFIHEFEVIEILMPEIKFRVVCSKGTYIRSLARDFGKALGSGAYLAELRRTRIGKYRVEDAISMVDVEGRK